MNKIKHNLKEAKEYILELSKAKRTLYIIFCLLFLIEYVFNFCFEIYTFDGVLILFEYFEESFETLYSVVIYPLLYLCLNIIALVTKKINWISLVVFFILQITYPGTILIIYILIISIFANK